jgi:hypothetical protein
MVPDHDCVPGLERAVTLSEYAKLEGLREADVLATIGQLKIPAAYFRGQWFVEAPPNCETRLAQLRAKQRSPDNGDYANNKQESIPELLSWLRERSAKHEHTQARSEPERAHPEAPPEPQRGYGFSELPRADHIDQHVDLAQPSAAGHHPQRVDVLEYPQPPQPASDTPETPRPQPVDYGLTFDDLDLYYGKGGSGWRCKLSNGEGLVPCYGRRETDKYKNGKRWFRILPWLKDKGNNLAALAVWALIISILMMLNKDQRLNGVITFGVGSLITFCGLLPGVVHRRLREKASPALESYWQALDKHLTQKAAVAEAAEKAKRDADLRRRSYWTILDGYEFERATAEVLNKHQFNPRVTPGSGDGGIDIEVTRNGLKGVVQCKAHVACAGPHVVRDLYGVIHHSGADFGIIVSRGGFSRGAVDFAREKPILFVDTSDLIAMQEGRASAFSRKDS